MVGQAKARRAVGVIYRMINEGKVRADVHVVLVVVVVVVVILDSLTHFIFNFLEFQFTHTHLPIVFHSLRFTYK